jgi:hypothetical protein
MRSFETSVLSLLAAWGLTTTEISAALHCTEAAARVGTVRAGVPLARTFEIVNRGSDVVEVAEVKTTCGCLRPRLGKMRFGPGDFGTLHLEINTLTVPAGGHTWKVTIRYLEAGRPGELELSVAAVVQAEVTVEPASLVVYTGSALAATVTLIDRRDRPLTIVRAVPTTGHVAACVETPRRDAEGRQVQAVQLNVLAALSEGRHEETLSLYTDDPRHAELRMPFTVVKRSAAKVSAAPAAVTVTAALGAAPPSRIVLLRPSGGEAVQLERVEADHPAVRCTWAAGPGTNATLKIAFDAAKLPAEGVQGFVRAVLREPKGESVLIPFTCSRERGEQGALAPR